jgi:hypothetical protein
MFDQKRVSNDPAILFIGHHESVHAGLSQTPVDKVSFQSSDILVRDRLGFIDPVMAVETQGYEVVELGIATVPLALDVMDCEAQTIAVSTVGTLEAGFAQNQFAEAVWYLLLWHWTNLFAPNANGKRRSPRSGERPSLPFR